MIGLPSSSETHMMQMLYSNGVSACAMYIVLVPGCDLPSDIAEAISRCLKCKAGQFHGGVYNVTYFCHRCVCDRIRCIFGYWC